MAIVTVSLIGKPSGDAMRARYRLWHSQLPEKSYVRDYHEMVKDLMVACDMTAPEARAMVLDAYVKGEASRGVGE